MFHLIKYSVIRKVKNFSMLFWPCMFPLILGTLFYFAFGNISESDFETVQAAFVEENPGDSVFPSFLEEVSKEGTLIHVETMTEKEALQKLEDQKISGIFYGTETPYLKVGKNGLAQSIMQSLLESYLNGKDTLETVADVHPENMKKAVAAMSDYQELVENVSAGGRTTNGNMGFFYALAAMACMYGCFIGLGSAMWLQANLSTLAARQCVSPVHRLKMILTELISSFFKCGDFNCLLQICTSDGISGKYGKNAADCGGRLCNRSEYGNSGVQYRQVQRGDQGWNHAWDFYDNQCAGWSCECTDKTCR